MRELPERWRLCCWESSLQHAVAGTRLSGRDGKRVPDLAGQYSGAATYGPQWRVGMVPRNCYGGPGGGSGDRRHDSDGSELLLAESGRRQDDNRCERTPGTVDGSYATWYFGAPTFGGWVCRNSWRAVGTFDKGRLDLEIAVSPAVSSPGGLACDRPARMGRATV